MKEIQEIAERLKGIREMEEISTAEMAECAGISENEYIDYESGKRTSPLPCFITARKTRHRHHGIVARKIAEPVGILHRARGLRHETETSRRV